MRLTKRQAILQAKDILRESAIREVTQQLEQAIAGALFATYKHGYSDGYHAGYEEAVEDEQDVCESWDC